ncbi:MAG: Gfo/Idh/MocA family oxidoreductase, partial [Paracoccus sp. (in: a-proteobacteria)]
MLNIAIAGFGWWGRHILTRLQGHDRLSVLAVAEPDQSLHADIRAMGAEAVSGFDGVLSDPRVQAVVLTTPHMMHEEQVVAAA